MMYHLRVLIAAHRARLVVAALGYTLYAAIDPASSPYAGFAYAAVILLGLIVFVPAMLFAAHIDRIKPGKVEKPIKLVFRGSRVNPAAYAGRTMGMDDGDDGHLALFKDDIMDPFNMSLSAQALNPANVWRSDDW